MAFKKAERRNSRLRLALSAPSGGGKTWTMIQIFKLMGIVFAVLDSERGSALKYARKAGTEERPGNWDFDHEDLDTKSPQSYIEKIHEAAEAGYAGLGIDSYSHSWLAALEQIDAGGGWTRAGKNVSPRVAKLVDAILNYPGHVIATMRATTHHEVEKGDNGKVTMRKMGLAPVVRSGTEFEFDLWLDLERDGTMTVSKSRLEGIPVGEVYTRDQIPKLVETMKAALDQGVSASAFDSLRERIGFAADEPGLATVLEEWIAARGAGQITDDEQKALKAVYVARKRELSGAT